jgi:hypothetical protein
MGHLQVDGAKIQYEVRGDGEPVLLIPLSLGADGLAARCSHNLSSPLAISSSITTAEAI